MLKYFLKKTLSYWLIGAISSNVPFFYYGFLSSLSGITISAIFCGILDTSLKHNAGEKVFTKKYFTLIGILILTVVMIILPAKLFPNF
jgi:hypothetical protein